ncbi:hypothetical protein KP509_31G004000 [Ceratopteris richardii]|uniref:Uncharacterized protein n=1 Tax=Ceratopteris richardii TaxID=49495 RepID=A0A8T2QWQ5_CERRI|nr:hypothetical protein KP509_31G004000 [Ceratopteris richardii]
MAEEQCTRERTARYPQLCKTTKTIACQETE